MKEQSLKEPKLTYALNGLGRMVCINSVARGLACNCHCPKCNEALVAKLGYEGGRQAHFAHQKGSDCHGSYMTALHRLAEQIIEDEKEVMAPAYKEIEVRKLSFSLVEVEQRTERKDLQPDVVGETDDGLRWFIEIRNTHEIGEYKKAKLIESDITCLEIDVREQTLDSLKAFLLESADNREWLNNPNYDKYIAKEKQAKIALIEKYLLERHFLIFPAYENYESQEIKLKEVSKVFCSADGLYARFKVVSVDGIPYILDCGSRKDIENYRQAIVRPNDYSELSVYTDNLTSDANIHAVDKHIEWTYHYVSEKEKKATLEKFRNNPEYEIRLSSYCTSECKYRPFYDKCIYKKDTIGTNVVCNKKKRLKDELDVSGLNSTNALSQVDYIKAPSVSYTPDDQYPRTRINTLHERFNYQRKPSLRTTYHPQPTELLKDKKQYSFSNTTSIDESLPFSPFWTIEDYYRCLQQIHAFRTETNDNAEIIKCENIYNCAIVVLYKNSSKVKSIYPYHIAVVKIQNGEIQSNNVADFTNKNSALGAYNERINAMRGNPALSGSKTEEALPF